MPKMLTAIFLLLFSNGPSSEAAYSINARTIYVAIDPIIYETEADNRYEYTKIPFDPQNAAIVLIDVWDRSWLDGFGERANLNVLEKLLPALEYARSIGMTVVHCHHLSTSPYKINPYMNVLPGEYSFDGPDELNELDSMLRSKGINTVFFAGYATNMCILARPVGVAHFATRTSGYTRILLRDATEAAEFPQQYPLGTMRDAAIAIIEMNKWAYTASVDEFINGH
jgi:nicotinamidase-related amidase